MIDDLRDKIVLITGGATGIGASTVRAFSSHSSTVYFSDVNAKDGESLSSELGSGVHFSKIDMSEEGEVREWVEFCGNENGRIDCVVNNVGNDERCDFISSDLADIKSQFELNYYSALHTIHPALKYLKKGSLKSIINYGSVTYHLGEAELSGYVPAKAALYGLTRTLARELGKDGIRVNLLSPGWVMTEKQLEQRLTPESLKFLENAQCDPRKIQPEEISKLVLFLASHASAAITGQNILADRGWTHV